MENEKSRRALIYTPPVPGPLMVEILVTQGTVSAVPNSGAVRVAASKDQVVNWICAQSFSLSFAQLGGTPQPLDTIDAEQRGNSWIASFEPKSYPPTVTPPFYKYTVKVGELTLDPVVIVDR
jgi:hypothetical protein